jgi:hypothetical protein
MDALDHAQVARRPSGFGACQKDNGRGITSLSVVLCRANGCVHDCQREPKMSYLVVVSSCNNFTRRSSVVCGFILFVMWYTTVGVNRY